MEKEILELCMILAKSKRISENYNFLIISEDQWVRVVNNTFEKDGIPNIDKLELNRGQILDIFSKLEYLINAIIQINVLGPNSKNNLMLDEILVYVDLFSRLKLLKDWEIINGKLFGLLMETKQVRNGFAHSWGYHEIRYKGKIIIDNFDEFKKKI